MRRAAIYYKDVLAGMLTESEDGDYIFVYEGDYVKNYPGQFLTFTMPVNSQKYVDKRLFSFFEGLIPEGWLLDIASKNWKINPNDRMGLLLACCQNCIGAVRVQPITEPDE
jgi:serine/threonine-protein kinase HipA